MRYKAYPGTILTSCCGQNYLLTPQSSMEMNETASFYWRQLEKGTTVEGLMEATMKVYDIEDERALEEEINTFINALADKKLIMMMDE